MKPSNEELIQACRQGDGAAWETLVRRYERLVYSIPLRAGLDRERAAEVFQQVFTKFIEHLDRIQQPDRIGAWLATTARRETWSLSQQESLTDSLSLADHEEESHYLATSDPLPDKVLLRLEEQNVIHLAVAELNEPCRRLLGLLFFQPEPPSYAEIAGELGISEGSISPTRIRCLKKLRRLLDNLRYF
jgi:RNA polymerase sigma factor (sigma-70 family)